eukprot:Hpha_TRINITY_DN7975_c0_g1::TRINITY_DN7975_c0_g1_i1::g.146004::m.146004
MTTVGVVKASFSEGVSGVVTSGTWPLFCRGGSWPGRDPPTGLVVGGCACGGLLEGTLVMDLFPRNPPPVTLLATLELRVGGWLPALLLGTELFPRFSPRCSVSPLEDRLDPVDRRDSIIESSGGWGGAA